MAGISSPGTGKDKRINPEVKRQIEYSAAKLKAAELAEEARLNKSSLLDKFLGAIFKTQKLQPVAQPVKSRNRIER